MEETTMELPDLRQKIVDQQQKLKQLASTIPGFGGYLQKEDRRDADKLLRLHLARQLDEQRSRLNDLSLQLISSGNLKAVGELGQVMLRLQTLIDRIKTATYGHAGFFDAVRIQEVHLDALYTYDNSMLQGVPLLSNAISSLNSAVASKEGIEAAISGVLSAVDQLSTAWNQRQEVILQV